MDLIPVEVQPFNLYVDGCWLHNPDCGFAIVGSRPLAPLSANARARDFVRIMNKLVFHALGCPSFRRLDVNTEPASGLSCISTSVQAHRLSYRHPEYRHRLRLPLSRKAGG